MAVENVQISVSTIGVDSSVEQLKKLGSVSGDNVQAFNKTNEALIKHATNIKNVGTEATSAGKGISSMGEAGRGLTGIMTVLARLFGVNTEAIKTLSDTHAGLREAMRSVGELTRAQTTLQAENTVATEEQTAATEAQVVANEEMGASFTEALGPIGLAIAATAALAFGIYEYISAQKEAAAQDKAAAKSAKDTSDEIVKLREKEITAQDKLDIATKKKTQAEVDLEIVERDRVARNTKLQEDNVTQMKSIDRQIEEQRKLSEKGNDAAQLAAEDKIKELNDKKVSINSQTNKTISESDFLANTLKDTIYIDELNKFKESQNKKVAAAKKAADDEWYEVQKLQEEIKLARDKGVTDKIQSFKDEQRDREKYDITIAEHEGQSEKVISLIKLKYAEETKAGIKKLQDEADEEAKKRAEEARKRAEQAMKEHLKIIEEGFAKELEALEKKFKDEKALSDEFYNDQVNKEYDQQVETAKNKLEADKNNIHGTATKAQSAQLLQDQIDIEKSQFSQKENTLAEWKEKEQEKINKEYPLAGSSTVGKNAADTTEIQRQTEAALKQQQIVDDTVGDQQIIDTNSLNNNIAALKKEARDKERKDTIDAAIDTAKQLTDLAIQTAEAQNQAVIEANNFRIGQAQSMQQTQATLAAAGLKNDLAFEEQRNSALEKQQIQATIREKKLKEAGILLNLIESFTKNATNPSMSLGQALAAMAGVNAATAHYAEEGGVIGEIKERSYFGRKHKGGGDILLHAQTGEGILNRKEMQNLGGPEGFKKFRTFLNVPYYKDLNTNFNQQVIMHDNSDIIKELNDLKKVIRDKKELMIEWDTEGNRFETSKQNGRKIRTKHTKGLR